MSSMSQSDSPDWYPATQRTQVSDTDRTQKRYREELLSDSHENSVPGAIATPESPAYKRCTVTERISSRYVPSESQGSVDLFGSYEMKFSNSGATQSQASSRESLPSVKTPNSPPIDDQTPPLFTPHEDSISWEPVTRFSSQAYWRISGDVKPPPDFEYDQCFSLSQPDQKLSLENKQVVSQEELKHCVTGNLLGLGSLEVLETDKATGGFESQPETPEEESELFDFGGGTDSTHYSPKSSHSWLGVEGNSQDFGSDASLSPLLPDREMYLAEEEKLEQRTAKIQQEYEDYLLALRISKGMDPFSQKTLRSRSSQGLSCKSSSYPY